MNSLLALLRGIFAELRILLLGLIYGHRCMKKGCGCAGYCDDATFYELQRQAHDQLYAARMLDSGVVGRKLKCDLCGCAREGHQWLAPRRIEPQYMPNGGVVVVEQRRRAARAKKVARFAQDAVPEARAAPKAVKAKVGDGETVALQGNKLASRDVKAGDGPTVELDAQVRILYNAAFHSDLALFEENQELRFKVGAGKVIAGLDQGVRGMRVGGTRIITIPPEWAYGEQDVIDGRKGETLQFAVTVTECK